MAEQPLLLTEIGEYCDRFYFDTDQEFFFYAMAQMDQEYLKYKSEKREQEQSNKPAGGNRTRPKK